MRPAGQFLIGLAVGRVMRRCRRYTSRVRWRTFLLGPDPKPVRVAKAAILRIEQAALVAHRYEVARAELEDRTSTSSRARQQFATMLAHRASFLDDAFAKLELQRRLLRRELGQLGPTVSTVAIAALEQLVSVIVQLKQIYPPESRTRTTDVEVDELIRAFLVPNSAGGAQLSKRLLAVEAELRTALES